MIELIKKKFEGVSIGFGLVIDPEHPLKIMAYITEEGSLAIGVYSKNQIKPINSCKLIKVKQTFVSEEKYLLSFILQIEDAQDNFYDFCSYIMMASRQFDDEEKSLQALVREYIRLKDMWLGINPSRLSENEIKGLIAELRFLKSYMFKKYGIDKALASWVGPEGSDQDFIVEDTWYEVKGLKASAQSVSISSVEQLDRNNKGMLCLVYLEKTSEADAEKININSEYNSIIEELNEAQKIKFKEILMRRGFKVDPMYDSYTYRFIKKDLYEVDDKFPCIRRNILPQGIQEINYTLSIPVLSDFLRNDLEELGCGAKGI